jgi:hypothetical protein
MPKTLYDIAIGRHMHANDRRRPCVFIATMSLSHVGALLRSLYPW